MFKRDTQGIGKGLVQTALLALAYAIAGKLALLLAIPPGYATAIFPSAGIAVAALLLWGNHLWLGVLLGSLLLNLWIGAEHAALTVSGLVVAASAASGASLQALAGAYLVRRFVGFPTALSQDAAIFKFMLLAGPVACLLNASFGATALYATGTIAASAYSFSWFTWWVGDSIGVMFTVPLLFIVFAQPRGLWWGRRTAVAIPLLLALTTVVALFYWASKVEQERLQSGFNKLATDMHEKMRFRFAVYTNSVAYIDRFFSSTQEVTRDQFRSFVAFPLANFPGIQALSWNPVVTAAQRDQFEQSVRHEGFHTFQIVERDNQHNLMRAAPRSEYVPVQFIEPMQGNENAFGFDVASNAERRKTLLQAADTGNAHATSRISLVQDRGEQAGFLLFKPVYHGQPQSVEERRKHLRGFAVGVFRVSDMVDSIVNREPNNHHIVISIHETIDGKNVQLYGTPDANTVFSLQEGLTIGGREWIIGYSPSPSYLLEQRAWQSWGLLASGLSLVSLLGVFLLAMTGRAYQVEYMVARRTAELRGILSTAAEAIITCDISGKIESVNPAGEALFDYRADELIGTSIQRIIPDFFDTADLDTNDTTTNIATDTRRDTSAVKKDGTNVSIELATSAVKLVDRTFYTVIIHDLTERKKIDRMKDEFISTISHELRTPLTSISGSLALITGRELYHSPEKIKPLLTIAYENCGRLAQLVDDLLTFNKNTLGEKPLSREIVSVNTLIEHSIKVNQGYATKYGVTFSWTPTAEDAYVDVDEGKLIQVISNVLSNAVKYSPKDGRVMISTTYTASQVRISIQDFGTGIPLEFQDKVFERFTQADSSDTRRVGGTGLGMAIAKALIEKHDGCISFVSEPGQGTTFYIDLPLVPKANS